MAFVFETILLTALVGSIQSTEFHSGQLDVGDGVLEPISVMYNEQNHVTIIDHQESEGHMLVVYDGLTGDFILKDVETQRCLIGKATANMIRQIDEISTALRIHNVVHIPDNTYTFTPSGGLTVSEVARSTCTGSTVETGHFIEGSHGALTREYWCWGLSFGRTCVGVGGAR